MFPVCWLSPSFLLPTNSRSALNLLIPIRGKTLQTKTEERIEQNELAARVRSDAFSMLLPPSNQR